MHVLAKYLQIIGLLIVTDYVQGLSYVVKKKKEDEVLTVYLIYKQRGGAEC